MKHATDTSTQPDGKIETIIELMFFAYRDFIGDSDIILEKLGFGRAHHRVLHFVDRKEGLTVAELLELLRITKQSLARVLKQLIDSGYIEQREGAHDRRQRKLYLTENGYSLISQLREPQSRRIKQALNQSGQGPEDAMRFLDAMLGSKARRQIKTLG